MKREREEFSIWEDGKHTNLGGGGNTGFESRYPNGDGYPTRCQTKLLRCYRRDG